MFASEHVRGHPHGNAFVCKHTCFASVWAIVHMDPVNTVLVNAPILKPGLRVEKFENAALASSCGGGESAYFAYWWRHRPIPRPLNLSSHNNNNNNNGGLHACIRAAEDIEPIRVTRAKYNAPLPLRWAKKEPFSSSSCCVWFLLLRFVCIQCASFMCMLRLLFSSFGEIEVLPIGLEYELKPVELFTMDPCKYSWNDAKEDGGEKDRFGTCGHVLSAVHVVS